MKKQSNRSSAFFKSHLRISLFVFLAGVVLAVFGNAFAQQRQTQPTRNVAQKQNFKARVQRPDQGFWAQTNGPQGGDGIASRWRQVRMATSSSALRAAACFARRTTVEHGRASATE